MNFEIKINDKLLLKLPKIEDAMGMYEVIDKDRKHLSEWLAWVDKTNSIEDSQDNIKERIEKFKNKEAASFIAYYEDKPIGSVGFVSIDKVNKSGEIGYWIASEFSGKGLMTECVRASINYGFDELDLYKIIIKCNSKNTKSARIPKRLGFKQEKTLINDRFKDGVYSDTLTFRLLKTDWIANRQA